MAKKIKKRIEKGIKTFMSMPVTVKSVDKENHTLTMVASSQDVDRHGDVVIQSGWDLKPYKKNPVILNSHNYFDVTEIIAKATSTKVEGKGKKSKLIQVWKFAVEENPKAEIIFNLYAGGFAHASSVGFIPRKFAENKDGTRDWYTIEEAELLEVSAVSVPANAAATIAKSIGIDVAQLKEAVELDEDEDEEAEETEEEETTEENEEAEEVEETEETETEEESEEETEEETAEEETDDVDPDEQEPESEETPADKTMRLKKELAEHEAEHPAPASEKKVSHVSKVLKAIHNIEDEKTRALKSARVTIDSLLDENGIKTLDQKTQDKIRSRKVNQAIRKLIKAK